MSAAKILILVIPASQSTIIGNSVSDRDVFVGA